MRRQPDDDFQQALAHVSRRLVSVFQPAAPFILHAAVTMGAYTAGLAATQAAGMALRVSCATPVLGPLSGFVGVGVASALAGQASIKCRQAQREGWRRATLGPRALLRTVRPEDLVLDAVLGIAAFRLLGGRFRSVMPSDVAKVGAIARESIPAAGMQYAVNEKRRELARIYVRDGCHHCGSRRGHVIGDHMPPNKHVADSMAAARKILGRSTRVPFINKYVRQAAAALGLPVGPPRQRYYPQCQPCSQLQSAAVRNNRTRLVLHEVLHRGGKRSAWHCAGLLVGLRHYGGPAAGGNSSGDSPGRRRM